LEYYNNNNKEVRYYTLWINKYCLYVYSLIKLINCSFFLIIRRVRFKFWVSWPCQVCPLVWSLQSFCWLSSSWSYGVLHYLSSKIKRRYLFF
jgi:hypothetical protein